MVRTLLLGEADMAFTSVTLTSERFEAVDYLIPMAPETPAVFVHRMGEEKLAWQDYYFRL